MPEAETLEAEVKEETAVSPVPAKAKPKKKGENDSSEEGYQEGSGEGQAAFLKRDCSEEEVGLSTPQLASALADTLDQASGECAIAIIGPWGRGKTFLAKTLDKVLSETPREHTYEIVWHSAWKYQQRPECWVHLYRTLSDACDKPGGTLALARRLRLNILKYGSTPLITSLTLLALAFMPWNARVSLIQKAAWLVGATAVYYLVAWTMKTSAEAKKIAVQYGTLPKHSSHLGLQEVIGADLRLLTMAWTEGGSKAVEKKLDEAIRRPLWGVPIGIALLGYLEGGRLAIHAIPILGFTLAWALAAALIRCQGDTERILLIVDDVDRARPENAVELLEGLKLMLEDEAVANKVQVVYLIETTSLYESLTQRYETTRPGQSSGTAHGDRVFLETLEKLFSLVLQLPPLTNEETREVLEKAVDSCLKTQKSDKRNRKIVRTRRVKAADPLKRPAGPALSRREADALIMATQEALGKRTQQSRPSSPRLVRSIIMKYLFLRALHQRLHPNTTLDRDKLIAQLVEKSLHLEPFTKQGEAMLHPVEEAATRSQAPGANGLTDLVGHLL